MTDLAHITALQRGMTWLAFSLAIVLIAFGVYWHGFSAEVSQRFWSDITGRISGPMTFRLFLQPVMGFIAALPDGISDAHHGSAAFGGGRLKQGLVATSRIMLLGLSIDLFYQLRVFHEFYPAEAVLFAFALCVIPYFIWRWLVANVVRRWSAGGQSSV